MTMRRKVMGAIIALAAVSTLTAAPAGAQTVKVLIDPNDAGESELAQLPNVTPAIARSMVEKRPFKTIIELHKFLLDQKLSPAQAKDFYGKAFVKINLNAGTKEEFLLIPGVGSRMSAELQEYRPWKTWTQFDKEIGKYVGQQEVERLKQYVFIPPS